MLHGFYIQHCKKRCESTHTVILSVCKHHAAIQTTITCFSCRNNLQFCRKKIFLFHLIILFQQLHYICLDSFFFFLFQTLILFDRTTSDQQVQLFSFNNCGRFLFHLLCCKMDQQICNNENRIIFLFSNADIYNCSILFCDHSVQCQRKCNPLILLNSAIIMCIKISKFIIFIKWVLLYINAWGIYMGSEKIHSLFQWLCSHMEHCDGLVHAYCVYLISCLYFFTVSDDLFQVLIPFFFNSFNRKTYTFPLCLSGIQAGLIILIYCLKTAQFLCTVLTPCIFSLH